MSHRKKQRVEEVRLEAFASEEKGKGERRAFARELTSAAENHRMQRPWCNAAAPLGQRVIGARLLT